MSKRILVAGGAGFLGSYICEYYLGVGYIVDCLDNLSTSTGMNIRHLKKNNGFHFVQADIASSLPKRVRDNKYQVVINLASPASPPHYQRLAIETLQAGSQGTLNLLELARQSQARFFHASTSEVYGDPEVHPQPESYWGKVHSYGPRSMYDESKRYAEALIFSYRQKYGLSSCIARFFNTYGPRMDPEDGRVVSNFIVQALEGHPITIYGKGLQTRSFCYVDDLVKGITALIDSDETKPMNLGNPGEFTIKELAEMVIKKTGSKSKIVYLPLPGDDPTQRKPDITFARKMLGWSPSIPLEKGIELTIDYFAELIKKTKTDFKTPRPIL